MAAASFEMKDKVATINLTSQTNNITCFNNLITQQPLNSKVGFRKPYRTTWSFKTCWIHVGFCLPSCSVWSWGFRRALLAGRRQSVLPGCGSIGCCGCESKLWKWASTTSTTTIMTTTRNNTNNNNSLCEKVNKRQEPISASGIRAPVLCSPGVLVW